MDRFIFSGNPEQNVLSAIRIKLAEFQETHSPIPDLVEKKPFIVRSLNVQV